MLIGPEDIISTCGPVPTSSTGTLGYSCERTHLIACNAGYYMTNTTTAASTCNGTDWSSTTLECQGKKY